MLELKNTVTKLKKQTESFNIRLDQTEELSKLKDWSIKITSQGKKKKKE